ncbi:hypothetical protein RhiirC2_728756 [Rhizophagus irregularis]|uniref:F-box domain-containing protein n=1 Tax=Rhizophagus irregularis TaxID=588596 RepID=A0A2N1NY69_9GLOM|nr:hypothetical protein RhiirC2_728756 [Rhizophagus irregularis]
MDFPLPTECVEDVISNLEINRDLFSALMVNREWCKFAVPILWKNPFDNNNRENHCKKVIMRTYLSCLDQRSKLFLESNGVDLSCTSSSTAFDYASYLNYLSTTSLKFRIQQYMFPQAGFCGSMLNEHQKTSNQIKLIFTILCKHFISRSVELKYIEFSDFGFDPLNVYSIPFATFEGANRSLANLQIFCFHGIPGKSNNAKTFVSMSNVCKNISHLEITLSTLDEAKGLASLISVQNHLEHFKLVSDTRFTLIDDDIFGAIFRSLATQSNTFRSIFLQNVSFTNVDFKSLAEFGKCKALRSMTFIECEEIQEKTFNAISNAFPLLEHVFYVSGPSEVPSQSFCEIFKTAQLNIKSVSFDVEVFGLIETITKFCTKLEDISVNSIDPTEIILILSNCKELKYINFRGEGGIDANDIFIGMARSISPNLEILSLNMSFTNPWIFSPESLKIFLDSCKNTLKIFKIYHYNAPFNIRDLEDARIKTMNEEHFNVIRQSGITFHMDSDIWPRNTNIITTIDIPENIEENQ